MTNILIPTDLTAESLQLAERALSALEPRNANIILFHVFDLPSSAFDLLVPGRRKPYADAMNDSFRQACKQLKEQHLKAVQKVYFKYLEGNSSRLFRNFVDANEIDMIICPDDFNFHPIHPLSVDPRPLIRKSGIRVVRNLSARREDVITNPVRIMNPVVRESEFMAANFAEKQN